jgi:hypothetical protein
LITQLNTRLARDKYSSLLQKFVTYGRKKFYNIGPRGQLYKRSQDHILGLPVAYFEVLEKMRPIKKIAMKALQQV